MEVHYTTQGDTRTPMGFQLKQKNTSGVLGAIDCSGLTLKVCAVKSDGTVQLTETDTGVNWVTQSEGKAQYDFQEAWDPGIYYFWAILSTSGEPDTFPSKGRQFKVVVHPREARA